MNPQITVIMPLYNAERFIKQSLNSVLEQSFGDYELIVVDDCSTDRSVEIVEGMTDLFDGRLRLIKRESNSGGSALPRNVGLRLARGKYIAFLDDDDLYTRTALEEMYSTAESTSADVVHADKFFMLKEGSKAIKTSWAAGPYVEKPEVINDVGARIKLFAERKLYWHVWSKVFRRDFLAEHCLDFPPLKIADDMMFCFYCLSLAKNYVRVPNVVNIYRVRKDSASQSASSEEERLCRLTRIMIEGTRELDRFMNGEKFFVEHGEFKHMAINFFLQYHIVQTVGLCVKRPPHAVEELLYRELSDEMGANAELLSSLLNMVNVRQAQLLSADKTVRRLQLQLADLKKQLNAVD